MNIKIIAIGKIKAKSPEMEIINEYQKRMKGSSLKIIELEVKNFSSDADKKQKEAELMQKHITDNDFIICMDEHGENLTSHQFSEVLQQQQSRGQDLVFIIGGAFGIHESLLNKSNKNNKSGNEQPKDNNNIEPP